jgi:hypothetical protein
LVALLLERVIRGCGRFFLFVAAPTEDRLFSRQNYFDDIDLAETAATDDARAHTAMLWVVSELP